MTTKLSHLLIVDDEPDFAEFLSTVAEGVGYRCSTLTSARGFGEAIGGEVDLIMLDLVMPDTDGIELLRVLAQARHRAGIILMSGFDRRVLAAAETLAKGLGLAVRGHIQKPIRAAELEAFLVSDPVRAARTSSSPGP
jgi:DNA-binding response OmpR family regulator